MTPKQKQIFDFATKNENQITKKQAVALIGGHYYYNAPKHVGDILSRMVKSQLLKRIKNGIFEINKNTLQDENQLSLWTKTK